MEAKQKLIAKMLELQHLFEPQSDPDSEQIVVTIKQAVARTADRKIQGTNVAPQVQPISHIIRSKMSADNYQLTLAHRTTLFDMEGLAEDIANKFISGIPNL